MSTITEVRLDSGRICFYDRDEDEFYLDATVIEDDGEVRIEGKPIGDKRDVLVFAFFAEGQPAEEFFCGAEDPANDVTISKADLRTLRTCIQEDL